MDYYGVRFSPSFQVPLVMPGFYIDPCFSRAPQRPSAQYKVSPLPYFGDLLDQLGPLSVAQYRSQQLTYPAPVLSLDSIGALKGSDPSLGFDPSVALIENDARFHCSKLPHFGYSRAHEVSPKPTSQDATVTPKPQASNSPLTPKGGSPQPPLDLAVFDHDNFKFACPVTGCGKSYRRRGDLKFHVLQKHESLGQTLPRHISKPKSDKIGKEFPCPVAKCKCGFKWERDLRRHIRLKHAAESAAYEQILNNLIEEKTPKTVLFNDKFSATWKL